MDQIEIDQEYIDRKRKEYKDDNRSELASYMAKELIEGNFEYTGTSYNFNLQDAINDCLGDDYISSLVAKGISDMNEREVFFDEIKDCCFDYLRDCFYSFLNQEDIGIA